MSSFLLVTLGACRHDVAISTEAICDKNLIHSPYLIEIAEAKQIIDTDSTVLLIELSEPSKYQKEHIPKAVNIWRPDIRTKSTSEVQGTRCTRAELSDLLSRLGVHSSTQLLIYDAKGAADALRFAWVLDYYSYTDYRVINGGLAAWKNAGYPTSSEPSATKSKSDYQVNARINTSILATIDDVKNALNDTNYIILDTREPYEYLGQPFIYKDQIHHFKQGAMTYGCIPGAVHLNWSDLADLEGDHRIKCEKDLRYNLLRAGVSPDKKIITYCQSGSRSSHTSFVLRNILKYPHVQNYDGSWIEWSKEYVEKNNVRIEQKTDPTEIEQMITSFDLKLKNSL